MTRDEAVCALALLGFAAAGGLAYVATRSAGPVPMPEFTEERTGALIEHLVTREELGLIQGRGQAPRMHYPGQVAPGVAAVRAYGWSLQYQSPDPQIRVLPSESD